MNKIRRAIITGLGTGRLPVAPGTWGSAAVCLIFLAVVLGSGGRVICVNGSLAVIAALSSAACIWLGGLAQETYGRKDPRQCTIDEWAGQAVALLGIPLGAGIREVLLATGVVFVLFRLFDIIKPPPARQLERLGGGWGILLDDISAAIYANVIGQLVLRLGLGIH